MKIPAMPQKGKPVADTIRDLINYVRATRVSGVVGGKLRESPNGTTIEISGEKRQIPANLNYPFKISVATVASEIRLHVNYGAVYQSLVYDYDPSGTAHVNGNTALVATTIGGSPLDNDPLGGTPGYSVLSVSTEYGVWLQGSFTAPSGQTFYSVADNRGYRGIDVFTAYTTNILVSSSYTQAADKPNNGEFWIFLGNVVIDASGKATITQTWRSDVMLPLYVLPVIAPSTDSGNSLYIGTDGKIFVPPIVSSDALNSISSGTDGGAFYDAP